METERLVIDRVRPEDKEDYYQNISHDKNVLKTFVCRYAETPEELDLDPILNNEGLFAIRLKETGSLIGIILLFDEKDGTCEIGYGIGSHYWNRGYVTEAAECFLEYCFEEKGMKTVKASYFTGNDASRRVMEKCGMTYSRFSPKEMEYMGVERDLTYYAIDRNTFRVHNQTKGNQISKKDAREVEIRVLEKSEMETALKLAWDVFCEYESPDYSAQGTEEFRKTLNDAEYLTGIVYYGAFAGNSLVGLLGIRREKHHICFFFVDGAYHRSGIGTKLFRRMLEDYPGKRLTLNSSPYGLPFYEHLGFVPTDNEQTVNGIRFTPMEYTDGKQV